MADLFELQLDSPRVRPGETLRGRLLFLTESAKLEKVRRLEVACWWSGLAPGEQPELGASGRNLLYALGRPGPIPVPFRFPFEFDIPERGPVSSLQVAAGELVGAVQWWLEVRLDVPWALDPKQVFPFHVAR